MRGCLSSAGTNWPCFLGLDCHCFQNYSFTSCLPSQPTLIADANHSMSTMTEESFGPIVAVQAVDTDEEAIALMNDSHYGLTAAVFTTDMDGFQRIAAEMQCGTVYMNRLVLLYRNKRVCCLMVCIFFCTFPGPTGTMPIKTYFDVAM